MVPVGLNRFCPDWVRRFDPFSSHHAPELHIFSSCSAMMRSEVKLGPLDEVAEFRRAFFHGRSVVCDIGGLDRLSSPRGIERGTMIKYDSLGFVRVSTPVAVHPVISRFR